MKLTEKELIEIKANLRWNNTMKDALIKFFRWGLITVWILLVINISLSSYLTLEGKLWDIGISILGFIPFYFPLLFSTSEKNFKAIPLKDSSKLQEYLQILKWKTEIINKDFIIATAKPNLFTSGETITIIIDSDRILVNSSYNWSTPLLMDKNEINLERLTKLIKLDNPHSS